MASIELLLEAEKRGILPPDKVPLLEEARKRGLVEMTPEGEARLKEFRAQAPERPTVLQKIGRGAIEHAPAIGSVVGGLAGALTPFPGGAFAGSITLGGLLGAVTGASIGTSAKQLKEQSEGKVKSVKETLGEQTRNVTAQALLELIGGVVGSGVLKVLNVRPFTGIREGAEIAQKALTEKGGALSASQAIESPTLSLAESFARAGAGGKGQFVALEKRNADALELIKTDLIQAISKDPVNDRVAGKLFQDAIQKGDAAHSIASTALYKQFDQRAGNILVDVAEVQKLGADISAQFSRIGGVGKSEAGGRLIDQLENLPSTLTFSDAHILRSNLLATIRDLKVSGQETVALRNATLAVKEVEKAMEAGSRNLPGNLFKEYREISAFYRKGKDAFNNDVVFSLLREQPERVGESLFKTGNVSEIIQAKASLRQAAAFDKSIDYTRTLNRMQAGYLSQLLTSRSAVNIEGETTARNLMKFLADSKTNRQFAVMFSEAERKAISDFGRTAFLTLQNKPAQFGILAPLLQAGAVGDLLLSGTRVATDITLLGSPYILAKALTNPRAVRLLQRGLELPAGTAVTGPVVTKLANEMNKIMTEQENKE